VFHDNDVIRIQTTAGVSFPGCIIKTLEGGYYKIKINSINKITEPIITESNGNIREKNTEEKTVEVHKSYLLTYIRPKKGKAVYCPIVEEAATAPPPTTTGTGTGTGTVATKQAEAKPEPTAAYKVGDKVYICGYDKHPTNKNPGLFNGKDGDEVEIVGINGINGIKRNDKNENENENEVEYLVLYSGSKDDKDSEGKSIPIHRSVLESFLKKHPCDNAPETAPGAAAPPTPATAPQYVKYAPGDKVILINNIQIANRKYGKGTQAVINTVSDNIIKDKGYAYGINIQGKKNIVYSVDITFYAQGGGKNKTKRRKAD
jgi:hypothetical protein